MQFDAPVNRSPLVRSLSMFRLKERSSSARRIESFNDGCPTTMKTSTGILRRNTLSHKQSSISCDDPPSKKVFSILLKRNESKSLNNRKLQSGAANFQAPPITKALSFSFKQSADVQGKTKQKKLIPLLRCAKKGRFDEILNTFKLEDDETIAGWLLDDGNALDTMSSEHSTATGNISSASCGAHNTILHKVMYHRPPVEVVDLLCMHLTKVNQVCVPEDMVNEEGMNPLHIAAKRGCDTSVIRRLLEGTSLRLPARTIDEKTGRTALHWACTNLSFPGLWAVTNKYENAIQNLYTLIKAYPQAKVVKDKDGFTPLFLAEKRTVDSKIFRALRPTREQVFRSFSGISMESNYTVDQCGVELPYDIKDTKETDDASSLGSRSCGKKGNDDIDESYYAYLKDMPGRCTINAATESSPEVVHENHTNIVIPKDMDEYFFM